MGSDPEEPTIFLTKNQEVGIIEEACMSRQLGLHHTKTRSPTHASHPIQNYKGFQKSTPKKAHENQAAVAQKTKMTDFPQNRYSSVSLYRNQRHLTICREIETIPNLQFSKPP
jgi:hypothetical protein